jgi:DNA primase
LAQACEVKFSARWYGRPGVLFGVRDRAGDLIAVQGRLIDGRDPKALTAGPKSEGVFSALNALDSPVCAIVEGPVDALALAAVGLPAVAMLGTNAPAWLARALHSKHVLLATDADQSGDECAARLGKQDLDQAGLTTATPRGERLG